VGKKSAFVASLCSACKRRKWNFVQKAVNITSLESVEHFLKNQTFTHIINTVEYTLFDEDEAFKVNVHGIENLALAAKKRHIKLLHYSTDAVFDHSKKEAYQENDFCNPRTLYGKTKWEGEIRLFEILSDALLIRTARPHAENLAEISLALLPYSGIFHAACARLCTKKLEKILKKQSN
jgi:dTDP-4-dehydrorhamnose reductase